MFRLWSLLIGYLCGNFLTAEVVARRRTGKSAYALGSGNPGMANIMGSCGFVPGVEVLAGDLAKTVAACVLCRFVLFPGHGLMAAAWAGLGVCLGHDFPLWHRFRGGEGVATTCAAIFCVRPLWGLIAMVAGMVLVFATRYLSMGAPAIPGAFALITWFLYRSPELLAVLLAMTVLMFSRHWDAFRRIRSGTERRVNVTGLLKKQFGRYTLVCIAIGTLVVLWFAIRGSIH